MSTLMTRRAMKRAVQGRRLRIAVVAPPWFEVPPSAYGGIEAMVAGLVDGLVARGHDVCLIGAGRNGTRAQDYVCVYDDPPSARLTNDLVPEIVHAAGAARALAEREVDVVHDNTLAGPLTAFGRAAPTVVTAHGSVSGEAGRYLDDVGAAVHLVAVSDAQRRAAPELHWVATVHNAVDVDSYEVGDGRDGYLLFLGRVCPEKGVHLAIDAAQAVGMPLVIAGRLHEPAGREYFEHVVRPRLGKGVTYLGEADAFMKRELYAGASALLFPVCWDEPFGLVMVEAMACGTPVVALRRGSVPEVVADGRTGFVVDEPTELAKAIRRLDEIDRAECRRWVEERFDMGLMVDGYEQVFLDLAERSVQLGRHALVASGSPSGFSSGFSSGSPFGLVSGLVSGTERRARHGR